jgi:carbohydrate-binding DOMON domain-containing protein
MILKNLFCPLLLFSLVACDSLANPTVSTPIPAPSIVPSQTPTVTLSPTVTLTPTRTNTPTISATATRTTRATSTRTAIVSKAVQPIIAPTSSPTTNPAIPPSGVRIGAVCRDGTTSTATGSGACSHHGGVAYWLY